MGWVPQLDHEATVPGLLHYAARRWPDHDLVVTENERLSYRDAEIASRVLAERLLLAGVGKGARIGTHFPYGTEWVVSWLAATRIGALHMPFSTAFKPAELRKVLALGDVELVLAPRTLFGNEHRDFIVEAIGTELGTDGVEVDGLPFLRDVWLSDGAYPLDDAAERGGRLAAAEEQVTPGDLAITIFTSGTTSTPKAVTHSHGALVRKGVHLARLQQWSDSDRVFCGMPFFWVGGVAMTVVPALAVGATLVCLDRTEPLRSLDLMEREHATVMTGWPGVRGPIMNHPTTAGRDIPALAPTGRAPMGSIGMTESLASYTWPVDREVPETVGMCMGAPIEGCDLRIADPETNEALPDGTEGAIQIRGYFTLQGMYKREREDVFTPDGYYDTGDKGRLVDGLVFFHGRLTEMIKTSGNNVAPPEVESVFRAFPDVQEAHVLGVPDAERGEIVAALVVPVAGATIDPEEVRERARKELSNYKVPRYVVVLEESELPWLATGKPDRLTIRAYLAERRP